ncbi:MAG: glycosyltransferase family 39 protein [Cellvibrionales bacterium]|nr:glycosyltransferase family 39 protein [Cellvibrionales bacterium]
MLYARWHYLLCLPLLFFGGEAFFNLVQVISQRAAYPFELEWMEGGVLQQVLRVVQHQPLYGEPSLNFVPALYMPLYYCFSAISVAIFGENLFALRAVSVAALVIIFLLVFLLAKRMAHSRMAGVLAVLFCAAMYPHTRFWFDLARVDTLWVMWLMLAWWCLLYWRDRPTLGGAFLCAFVSVLAFFTKQASLFLLPFVMLAIVCWMGWRALLAYVLCCAVVGLPVLGVLIIGTGGKFWFYTMQMASTHGVTLFGWRRFAEIVLWAVPTFLVLLPIFFCLMGKTWRERAGWFVLVGGFVFLSGLSRAYAGAFFNVLMPMYVCLAVVAAVVVSLLLERFSKQRTVMMDVLSVLAVAVLSLDIARFRYDPAQQVPAERDMTAAQFLLDKVRAVQGNVCITSHGYLAWMAGKAFCAHNTQVTDVMTGSDPVMANRLREDARKKILGGYYAVIVLDREKELRDLGLEFAEIPYAVKKLSYPDGPIRFPVNGYSPMFWLERK